MLLSLINILYNVFAISVPSSSPPRPSNSGVAFAELEWEGKKKGGGGGKKKEKIKYFPFLNQETLQIQFF